MGQVQYAVWLVVRWLKYAFQLGWRGTIPLGAAIMAAIADLAGVKMTFAENWQGMLTQAAMAATVAWLAISLVRLFIAPWMIWRGGKWYGNRFVYDEPKRVYSAFVGPADNNKHHLFRFPDAPPNSFVHCMFEVDFTALTNIDLRCRPQQLFTFTAPTNQQPQHIGVRVDRRRNLCMTTFMRTDGVPRNVSIFVTSWER